MNFFFDGTMYLDKELPSLYIYTLLNWFSVYGIFNSQNESSQVSCKRGSNTVRGNHTLQYNEIPRG